jgi:hypothetical protein
MKVVGLGVLRIGRLHPPRYIPGTHFCYRVTQTHGHNAAGSIKSKKNYNDTIGNRTRDLLALSGVPHSTELRRGIRLIQTGQRNSGRFTHNASSHPPNKRSSGWYIKFISTVPVVWVWTETTSPDVLLSAEFVFLLIYVIYIFRKNSF